MEQRLQKQVNFDDSGGLLILFPNQDDFIVWRLKKEKNVYPWLLIILMENQEEIKIKEIRDESEFSFLFLSKDVSFLKEVRMEHIPLFKKKPT